MIYLPEDVIARVPHTHSGDGPAEGDPLLEHLVTRHGHHPSPLRVLASLGSLHATDHPECPHLHVPTPAEILATAEDERHTLMAQEIKDHLGRMRAEMRRHEDAMAHIESVFRLRTADQPEVPEWITVNRKADIAQALRLVDAASAEDVARLIRRAGLDTDFHGLRLALAVAASEPGSVYPAWVAAGKILQAAR